MKNRTLKNQTKKGAHPRGISSIKTPKAEQNKKEDPELPKVEYRNAFLQKEKKLEPLSLDYKKAIELNQAKPAEKKFRPGELEGLIRNNVQELFSKDCILFNPCIELAGFMPSFLIDLKNSARPKLFFVKFVEAKESSGQLLLRITLLLSQFNNEDWQKRVIAMIGEHIGSDKPMRKKLQEGIGRQNHYDFLRSAFSNKPQVMLAAENDMPELNGFMGTYSEWADKVRPVVFRRFQNKGDVIITMAPGYPGILGNNKSRKDKPVFTEESHFEKVPGIIRSIYEEIKSAILKADKTVQFNSQKFYISLKKQRNLAFFHLRKKAISLVVVNSERDTRKQVRHHEIKRLPESVQRFWNAPNNCCTIVISGEKYLSEVINLLKKMVRNSDQ